jgi:Flp pilus assembly protein TadD
MDVDLQQLIERGRSAFQNRDYVAALADFREALTARPEFADIHNLSGLCLSFLGQPENAVVEFEKALALNVEYVEAHLNRAITLNELGRYDEAREAFERAAHYEGRGGGRFSAAVSARIANAHKTVGDLYLEVGAADSAAEEYRSAIALRPEFHDIRNKLAEALMQLGDLESAERELLTTLDGNGQFVSAILNLGLVHFYRGDVGRARAEWERARVQSPSNPQVRAYLSLLGRTGDREAVGGAG